MNNTNNILQTLTRASLIVSHTASHRTAEILSHSCAIQVLSG